MIEAIAAAGVEQAQASPATAITQPQASSHEVRDFAAAMSRNADGAQAPQAISPSAVEAPGQPSESGRSLLSAFDSLNGGAENIREMSRVLSSNVTDFSPSQMIKMTMLSQQFMFQAQLTSNVANRTSDGIQQLFRQQS